MSLLPCGRALVRLVCLLAVMPVAAQLPKRVPLPDAKLPSPAALLADEAPLTTSLADALPRVAWFDAHQPPTWRSGAALPQQANGSWRLPPGDYRFDLESYCLRAGTHGPHANQGDGYLNGPLRGAKANLVRAVMQRAAQHPEVTRQQVQALLWAIIARTRLDQVKGPAQQAAQVLLTADERSSLNARVWDELSAKAKQQLRRTLAPLERAVFDAEDDLRGLLRRPAATYAQLERAAVLTGDPAAAPGQASVPKGAWCLHPKGYLVAYLPEGYTRTTVQVHVPRPVHWRRDANGRLAWLATANGQRLQVLYDDREAPAGADRPGVAAHAYRALRLIVPDATRPDRLRELLLEQAGRVLRRRAEAPRLMLAADLGSGPAGPDATGALADLCGRLRAHGAAAADLGAATDLWYLRDSLRSAVAPHGLAGLLDDALVRACLGLPVPPAAAGTPGGAGPNDPASGGNPGGNQGTPGGNQGGGTPGGEGANNPGGGGNPGGNQGTPGGNQGGGTPGGEGTNNPGGGGNPGGNQGTPGGNQGGGTPGGEGTNNPGGGGSPDGNQGGGGGNTPNGGGGAHHPDGGGAPEGNHGGQPNGAGGGAPDGGGTSNPNGGGAPNGNHGGTPHGGGGKPHGGQGGQQQGGHAGDWSGSVDFDPTDGAAVPGHVGRQRLGVSARPSSDRSRGHRDGSGRRTTPQPGDAGNRAEPEAEGSRPPGGATNGPASGATAPGARSAPRGATGLLRRLARWWRAN